MPQLTAPEHVPREGALTRWLRKQGNAVIAPYAICCAFAVYFCMYAYRKPFTAGEFPGHAFESDWLLQKTVFIQSQLIGYVVSKIWGLKFCAEIGRRQRALAIVGLIAVAEFALVLFACLPEQSKFLALFLNGLPLGMIWGLVVLYLEGRRNSELLLAGLSCSYIVSSGMVKDVGRWLMADGNVSAFWMPAVVGALFFPVLLLFAWLMDQLPDPDRGDQLTRAPRQPMDKTRRRDFLREFRLLLWPLLSFFLLLTAVRDYRDNYGAEIFGQLGYGGAPAIFTRSETSVALAVIVCLGALFLIRDHRRAMLAALGLMFSGAALIGLSTLLLEWNAISGLTWMILIGVGIYAAYVPFGSMLFERLIAFSRFPGTAVYAIYVADVTGYLGSFLALLTRDYFFGELTQLQYCQGVCYAVSVIGSVGIALSAWLLLRTAHGVKTTAADSEGPGQASD